jgi:hypothetical protein
MENEQISSMPAVTTPHSADLIYLVDSTNVSQSAQGTSSQISLSNFLTYINANLSPSTSWTVAQGGTGSATLASGKILQGNGTGAIAATLAAPASTIVGISDTQTLTNKTITSSTDTLGGVTMGIGSDAQGDVYYNSGTVLARLGAGTATQFLQTQGASANPKYAYAQAVMATQPIEGNTQADSVTNFMNLNFPGSYGTTETASGIQMSSPPGYVLSMYVYVLTNSVNGTTTVAFRKNAASAGPIISISSTTTGKFSDTAHPVALSAGDLIDYQVVTTGNTGTIIFGSLITLFSYS